MSPLDGGNGLRAVLQEADAEGAEFLVIPAGSHTTACRAVGEPAAAMGGWRLVTHQRHLGDVYERPEAQLGEPAVTKVRSRPSAVGRRLTRVSADRERPTATGLWQRILGFFRR